MRGSGRSPTWSSVATGIFIGLVAFAVSLLTLFSGFGLGTLLMPAFALFFPVEVAVASTAVVHAANNLFKVGLLASQASRDVVLRFGLPAVGASFIGALLLTALSEQEALAAWSFLGRKAEVTPVKLVMGLLVLGFALFELVPALRALRAPVRWLPWGGVLSGFFGGLSGHQGALRAAFLAPLGLSPTRFVSTQAVLALLVDGARLLVYGASFALLRGAAAADAIPWALVSTATVCAFAGAFLGKRLLPKVTLGALHVAVGGLLLVVGLALASGVA
ncbi:MAG: sulfite exporter TauE/SafE family protein [Myxococcota bacterium]|nr:sulfite exporter TauE/SafE family protein [Myxococcota bacterium]